MKVAIHQPHYFPWEGYLDKMRKVDKFILMDDVQLTDSSPMYRHSFLTIRGEIKHLTIPFVKADYKKIPYRDIQINSSIDWQRNHFVFLKETYSKSLYFDEVMSIISSVFSKKYSYLCDVTVDTIILLKSLLQIETEILFQSNLIYPKDSKKNDLVLELCKAVDADFYLSGRGAKKYMQLEPFTQNKIDVEFQEFNQTNYQQKNSNSFVGGLSLLDTLLSIGIEGTKNRFYDK